MHFLMHTHPHSHSLVHSTLPPRTQTYMHARVRSHTYTHTHTIIHKNTHTKTNTHTYYRLKPVARLLRHNYVLMSFLRQCMGYKKWDSVL